MVKKSVSQTHRAAAISAEATAGSRGLALSPGWGGGGGGAATGDCETGRVSVSLRGSSSRGSGGMGLSGRQQRTVWGVSRTFGSSPPTEPHNWLLRPPHPWAWAPQALSAPNASCTGNTEEGAVLENARAGKGGAQGEEGWDGKGSGARRSSRSELGVRGSEGQWVWNQLGLLEGQPVGPQG